MEASNAGSVGKKLAADGLEQQPGIVRRWHAATPYLPCLSAIKAFIRLRIAQRPYMVRDLRVAHKTMHMRIWIVGWVRSMVVMGAHGHWLKRKSNDRHQNGPNCKDAYTSHFSNDTAVITVSFGSSVRYALKLEGG